MTDMQYIETELFSFAYIPSLYDQLDDLAEMALPEIWHFRIPAYETRNTRTPILERYVREVFRAQATRYNYAEDDWQANAAVFISNRFACFHTGLFTQGYKAIYAYFEPNRRVDSVLPWYFKGFVEETSPLLKYVSPLPQRPAFYESCGVNYNPAWPIRVNSRHILEDEDNLVRIPEELRFARNLPLLLETAVELGRRQALAEPGIVAPQLFRGQVQFLLPIALTDVSKPDLAMTLSIMDGYYMGDTCLTPQMAYGNARILGKPTARWLTDLVGE
jgi:hypothetical protein